MPKITPFLWFDDNAEEAVHFYASIFPDTEIRTISRNGDDGPGPKGSAIVVPFTLLGQEFLAMNGGPHFKFNEAVSFMVQCDAQEEIDHYWSKLTEGGSEVQCGWLKDRYGLSWQITPTVLGDLIADPDPIKAGRVMKSMMGMVKMDIANLKKAHEGCD